MPGETSGDAPRGHVEESARAERLDPLREQPPEGEPRGVDHLEQIGHHASTRREPADEPRDGWAARHVEPRPPRAAQRVLGPRRCLAQRAGQAAADAAQGVEVEAVAGEQREVLLRQQLERHQRVLLDHRFEGGLAPLESVGERDEQAAHLARDRRPGLGGVAKPQAQLGEQGGEVGGVHAGIIAESPPWNHCDRYRPCIRATRAAKRGSSRSAPNQGSAARYAASRSPSATSRSSSASASSRRPSSAYAPARL